MAAAQQKAIEWVMGVAFGVKSDLHAWIEVGKKPVLTSLDEQVEGIFQEVYRI